MSSVAYGGEEPSQAGYVSQCKWIQQNDPSTYYMAPNIDYSTSPPTNYGGFGGTLSSCTTILRGYHTGTLIDMGPAPSE